MNTIREVISTISEPMTVSEAKDHLRVTGTDEDEYIVSIMSVARKYVENEIGETLHTATYDYYLDEFPSDDIEIPLPPLSSVTYVKYYDSDNTLQTLVSGTDYRVDSSSIPGVIELIDSWPDTYDRKAAVQIRFIGGYTDFTQIDPMKIHAIKLKLSLLYDDRHGADEKMEEGLQKVLNKLRTPVF